MHSIECHSSFQLCYLHKALICQGLTFKNAVQCWYKGVEAGQCQLAASDEQEAWADEHLPEDEQEEDVADSRKIFVRNLCYSIWGSYFTWMVKRSWTLFLSFKSSINTQHNHDLPRKTTTAFCYHTACSKRLFITLLNLGGRGRVITGSQAKSQIPAQICSSWTWSISCRLMKNFDQNLLHGEPHDGGINFGHERSSAVGVVWNSRRITWIWQRSHIPLTVSFFHCYRPPGWSEVSCGSLCKKIQKGLPWCLSSFLSTLWRPVLNDMARCSTWRETSVWSHDGCFSNCDTW